MCFFSYGLAELRRLVWGHPRVRRRETSKPSHAPEWPAATRWVRAERFWRASAKRAPPLDRDDRASV